MLELACETTDRASSMAAEHLATGGKRLRARLALAACEALGGAFRHGVAFGAAVELLHNATLVHDDIQDGDTRRRGAPTLWATHGTAQAINAGDFLLMLPYLAVAELPAPVQGGLCRALAHHAIRTVRGQMAELDLLPEARLGWDDYIEAIAGKTGALIGLPICGAALISGASWPYAARLSVAFERLGVLFQLQDDVLDLYGDKGRECVGSDLFEGKVSALVVAHIERRPFDQARLLTLLRTPRRQTAADEVTAMIDVFRTSGALDDVLARISGLMHETRTCPVLTEEPALHRLALDLASLAVAPITHLIAPPSDAPPTVSRHATP
ncbi:MAG: polyprenyl synthetase family protein [Myxococcota bacterium]